MRTLFKKIGNRVLWALPSSGMIQGYDDPELIEFIFRKTKASDLPQQPWPELSNVGAVLDFGGGFGLHYRRARQYSPTIRWAIVETREMAQRATSLATQYLKFFEDIPSAIRWLGMPDTVYSNSVLQFTNDPLGSLEQLCGIGARTMIWHRVLLSSGPRQETSQQLSLLSENGPGLSLSRKRVEYTVTRIPEAAFIRAHADYRLTSRDGVQSDRDGENFTFHRPAIGRTHTACETA
jgi:putative methyltransferase (TIGR04325 family)